MVPPQTTTVAQDAVTPPPAVLQRFIDTRPRRPYCGNDLHFGLRIRDRDEALGYANIQLGAGTSGDAGLAYLAADYDFPDAAIAVAAACIPPPTLIVTNPVNEHAHVLWELATPIRATNAKALAYAEATRRGITRAIEADSNYTGRVVKNPLHPHWKTSAVDVRYALGDLAACVDLARSARWPIVAELQEAPGRNCSLFDRARYHAYGRIRSIDDEATFRRDIEDFVAECNRTRDLALPRNEVRSIAKSVANWVWKRRESLNGRSFVRRGACGFQSLPSVMDATSRLEEVKRRRTTSAARTNATRAMETAAAIREALTALRSEGHAISKAAVARRTGISDRSLRKRYAHLFTANVGSGDTRNYGVIRAPGTTVYSVFSGPEAVPERRELRGNCA